MRDARVLIVSAVLTAAVLLAGCTGSGGRATGDDGQKPVPTSAATVFPLTVTDDAGRSVTIESKPQRFVSVAPANTEILCGLGLIGEVVGVSTYDDYPAEVKEITKVGDLINPNIEAIASVRPDVILMTGGVQADDIAKLEGTGAKVLVVDPKTLDGVYEAIGITAQVAGVPTRGDELVRKMRSDLADIRKKVGSEKPVRCFMEVGWNPLFTAGKQTLLDDLMTQAGGVNVVTQKDYVGYSVEQLVKDQPEVYLGTRSSIGDAKGLAGRPGYGALECVKQGKALTLDDNLVSRPGPRVVEGVAEFARALHPDAFK